MQSISQLTQLATYTAYVVSKCRILGVKNLPVSWMRAMRSDRVGASSSLAFYRL
jgi:hypothetical protein